MTEYHKIQSIFKRDEKTHKFIEGEWSLPELEYLANNEWTATEKIDGTNIRVIWDGKCVRFGGKTDNAQIPAHLFSKLSAMFDAFLLHEQFGDQPACLYGEGYGKKIQKAGNKYIPDGVSFVLFDVRIGDWWLQRQDVKDIGISLGVGCVPDVLVSCTLHEAMSDIKSHERQSLLSIEPQRMEGFVLRPKVELFSRNRQRIITKIKYVDF